MKTTLFTALAFALAASSVGASGLTDRNDIDHGPRNAPVCPDGQVAQFVGVINGKATWRCVPA